MESISSDSDCDSVASYADVVKGESLFSSSPARLTNSCWFKFQVESEEEAMQIALKKSASDAQVTVRLPHRWFSDTRKRKSLCFICFKNLG